MTVTVTPTAEPSTGPSDPPRVRLDITDSGGLTSATITRLDPDGRTRAVRTGDGNPATLSGGLALLYDYEAPFGAVSYSSLESPGTVSAQVTLAESRVWLIHPGVPELSTPVTVVALGPRTAAVQRGVHRPLGRATAVVQTDGARKAAEWTLTLLTTSDDERLTLQDLVFDASVLLLNVPADKGWGAEYEYVSIGDIEEQRVSRFAGEPLRRWELPCTVVDRPVGGTQAERTYADVLVDNTSYATVMTRYGRYLDLLAGP